MKGKNVYLLFEEKNWECEEYEDVIGVFEKEEDALKALTEYRNDFVMEHEEDWEDSKENPDNWEIHDTPKHFQMLDEGMGYNYELHIQVQPIL